MVSTTGKNCSFTGGDDGFVPGEGVGSLLLKPMIYAKRDGNHIYATIKASAFEHSGRSNGYSAPNPNAQASVIQKTLKKANISPDTIGYVEGHGTGTQMGDSLEIAALTQVFRFHRDSETRCPVGSVKANIGHAESAAGIAGIIKVLLQMKHKKISPSLHLEKSNDGIDFENSPFYLQAGVAQWHCESKTPRRALVNSFGAGGVNACVVLEEYEQVAKQVPYEVKLNSNDVYAVLLSAMSIAQLHQYLNKLVTFLESNVSVRLEDLAYTLQIGREAMQERVVIIAKNRANLLELLKSYELSENQVDIDSASIFRGRINRHTRKQILADQSRINEIPLLLASKDTKALGKLWAQGYKIDWTALYGDDKPQLLSVPGYPFAKQRYWVSDSLTTERKAINNKTLSELHPLLTYNSSTLREMSFSSILPVSEYFARDHVINNARLLPGAAFLEMAYAAGSIAGEQCVAKIKDFVWLHPLNFSNGTQTVRTVLKSSNSGIELEIVSLDQENEKILHAEGILMFDKPKAAFFPLDEEKKFDINSLLENCSKQQTSIDFYQRFEEQGFQYGETFRAVSSLHLNDSYTMAKLVLSDELSNNFYDYILHPSILDGAFQTIAGLVSETANAEKYLPFAAEEVEILGQITPICYVHVKFAHADRNKQSEIIAFNIHLLNESGHVLLKINNFYVKSFSESQFFNRQVSTLVSHSTLDETLA